MSCLLQATLMVAAAHLPSGQPPPRSRPRTSGHVFRGWFQLSVRVFRLYFQRSPKLSSSPGWYQARSPHVLLPEPGPICFLISLQTVPPCRQLTTAEDVLSSPEDNLRGRILVARKLAWGPKARHAAWNPCSRSCYSHLCSALTYGSDGRDSLKLPESHEPCQF